ncbi:MAG: hypothetical protein ACM3ZE_08860 [Myxococcales bacterium]
MTTLVLRNRQMEVLRARQDDALAERCVDGVLEQIAELSAALGREKVVRVARAAIDEARGFGFQSDQELGEFVGLVFTCGERFYEMPQYDWAADALRSRRPGRLREIGDRVMALIEGRAVGES